MQILGLPKCSPWKGKTISNNKDNKKSYTSSIGMDYKNESIHKLLEGVGFYISRDWLDLYLRLGLNVCTTYKNGLDVPVYIEAESLILPEEPVLPKKTTTQQKKMWDLHQRWYWRMQIHSGKTCNHYMLDLYLKTIERLALHVFTTYKNGLDVQVCIKTESLILPEETVLPENPTTQEKKCGICMHRWWWRI